LNNIRLKEMLSGQNIALSLQHLLAMYAGAVIVPIIIAGALNYTPEQTSYIIAADIAICAVATLLQVYKGKYIGIGLPVVMATAFTGIGPIIQAGTEHGPAVAYGSVFAAGVIMLFLAPIFAKLNRLFPTLVTGIVVSLIGLTLIPVAINYIAGGEDAANYGAIENLIVGAVTFGIILLLYRYTKGFIQSISILIGMFGGMVVAGAFGMLDFTAMQSASWFQIPRPFAITGLEFEIGSIVSLVIVGIVTIIESTGNYLALGSMMDKELDESDLRKGYFSAAIGYMLSGLFNTNPQTAFSQNLGVIQMSGVKKREVILNLVVLMLIAGFIPKIGVIATAVPVPVLGGAMIFLFGNVLAYGISVIGSVDLNGNNQLVVGASIVIGIGVTVVPEAFAQLPAWLSWITSSGIVAGSMVAVLLNLFFNGLEDK
jgi:xanthine permease